MADQERPLAECVRRWWRRIWHRPCPHRIDGVLWNPWNRAIQCHRCGHVIATDTTIQEWLDERLIDGEAGAQ